MINELRAARAPLPRNDDAIEDVAQENDDAKDDFDACLAIVDWAIAKLDMHCGQSIVQTWELGFIVIIGLGHGGCFLFCFRFRCLLIVIISLGHGGLFFYVEWTW